MYDKVLLGIKKKSIRLLMLDNINSSKDLDIYLFDQLLKLWRESHGQFSVIMGIQMEQNANFYTEVGYLRGVMGATRHLCTDYLEVERLPEEEKVPENEEWEFEAVVIPEFLLHLNANTGV
jgi:hypothetical protein